MVDNKISNILMQQINKEEWISPCLFLALSIENIEIRTTLVKRNVRITEASDINDKKLFDAFISCNLGMRVPKRAVLTVTPAVREINL